MDEYEMLERMADINDAFAAACVAFERGDRAEHALQAEMHQACVEIYHHRLAGGLIQQP